MKSERWGASFIVASQTRQTRLHHEMFRLFGLAGKKPTFVGPDAKADGHETAFDSIGTI